MKEIEARDDMVCFDNLGNPEIVKNHRLFLNVESEMGDSKGRCPRGRGVAGSLWVWQEG